MRLPLISIIIPVYNSGAYIERCLQSLAKQDLTDIEVIIVNDGSSDCSVEICETYTLQIRNIKLFHQANLGVASARNRGLRESHGQWVTFIDSDDWVVDDYIEHIKYLALSNQAEVIRFGYFEVHGECYKEVVIPQSIFLNSIEDMLIINNSVSYYAVLWNSLIKRDIILDLQFDNDLKWSEDYIYMYNVYIRCKTMFLYNRALYYYRKNNDGLASTCKDPVMIRKAIDRGLTLKLRMVKSENNKLQILQGYHYWARQAMRHAYVSGYDYIYKKEFTRDFPLLDFNKATLLERIFYTNAIPFVLRNCICGFYYKMSERFK